MCGIILVIGDKLVDNEQLDAIGKLLDQRGPDYSSPICNHVTNCGLQLILKASVLHLRGVAMQKQPVADENGNLLLFNGQVYEFLNDHLDDDHSDTTILAKKLELCQTIDEIASTLSAVHGPFAFIHWNNNLNALFFGRDIFGRKSLCLLQSADKPYPCAISSLAYQGQEEQSHKINWSEVDCSGFHCFQFSPNGQLTKQIKFLWNLDDIYPPTSKCQPAPQDTGIEYRRMGAIPISPLNHDLRLPAEFSHVDRTAALQGLESRLLQAVKRRITYNRQSCLDCRRDTSRVSCNHSKVAIGFSGGIDSTLIAVALDKVFDDRETIDLTTVAFKNESPDRLSVSSAFKEIRKLCPRRNWRLILCDIPIATLQLERKQVIRHLINPCNTVVDDSLGCGCWFISRARGRAIDSLICDSVFDQTFESFIQYNTSEISSDKFLSDYTSPATIFFAGMGIDEQLGGYSSHRAAWSNAGTDGVYEEICKQMRRISSRNLGRDDRTCSHHGRDVKLPYLDFELVSYLNQLPIGLKMNLAEPLGIGPKKLLRELAFDWGLLETGGRVKRALQFGTRIANLEHTKEQGNEICSRLVREESPLLTKDI